MESGRSSDQSGLRPRPGGKHPVANDPKETNIVGWLERREVHHSPFQFVATGRDGYRRRLNPSRNPAAVQPESRRGEKAHALCNNTSCANRDIRNGCTQFFCAGGIDCQSTLNSVIWLALRRICSMTQPTSSGAPPISTTSNSNSDASPRRIPETMQCTKGPPFDGTSIVQLPSSKCGSFAAN